MPVGVFGARTQSGQITSGIGFAESLAEDELAAEDLLDVGVLLPRRPVDEQRGCEQAHPQAAEDHGGACLRHLLVIDRLHDRAGPSSAALARPRQLEPAPLVEAALPLALNLLVRVLPIAAHAAVAPLGRKVAIEPCADHVSEGLFFRSEAQIHDSEATKMGML
ncbi:MAG TPA: hypothetical protein VGU71_02080 [Candidatus Dormibacteraeota bacterium]|nr:hypothetical protein [Candidatus Dormibacteraeota bacterium]